MRKEAKFLARAMNNPIGGEVKNAIFTWPPHEQCQILLQVQCIVSRKNQSRIEKTPTACDWRLRSPSMGKMERKKTYPNRPACHNPCIA
jgi:hypothetical protein